MEPDNIVIGDQWQYLFRDVRTETGFAVEARPSDKSMATLLTTPPATERDEAFYAAFALNGKLIDMAEFTWRTT